MLVRTEEFLDDADPDATLCSHDAETPANIALCTPLQRHETSLKSLFAIGHKVFSSLSQ